MYSKTLQIPLANYSNALETTQNSLATVQQNQFHFILQYTCIYSVLTLEKHTE